ncbi:hypothetical protein EK21DRAFT_115471 [Setomelanomma holmii]|uniref:F-box domain-containing protein n=1 Tax=Setomelanomma holmii TaxID=210430 RepID=A0A9P4H2I5_9PLEO|nr:hypothetical protein EK21DRAFT_115471 [Setomelanomma holmii]
MASLRARFRFLDLPQEVSLMVYELLPIKVSHISFGLNNTDSLELVRACFPAVVILSVCYQINAKAQSILISRLNALREAPLRIVFNIDIISDDARLFWLLTYIARLCPHYDNGRIFGSPYPRQLDDELRRCSAVADVVSVQVAYRTLSSSDHRETKAREKLADNLLVEDITWIRVIWCLNCIGSPDRV